MTKTLQGVSRLYWWPKLAQDVRSHIQTCDMCQANKATSTKPYGLLQPLGVPGRRWESVSMDLITGLPKTADQKDAIVVFVDTLKMSKMVHLQATTTTVTAKEMARIYRRCVIRLHGVPRNIVSDRDSKFTSHFWKAVHQVLGTKLNMSTSFHPQSDGQTERVNRVLEEVLRHYVSAKQDDWDELLDMAEFAINNSWHESVRNTPFYLNYGQHPLTPVSLHVDTQVPAAEHFSQGIQEVVQQAKRYMQAAQDRQKAYADERRLEMEFQVGDKVLLNTKNIRLQHGEGRAKLLPRWIGPFEVDARVGRVAYKLVLPSNLHIHQVFHVSLLHKQYCSDGRRQPPPLPLDVDGHGELFLIDDLLAHRDGKSGGRTKREYLVKWKGYGPEHNTWEPAAMVTSFAKQVYWARKARQQAVADAAAADQVTKRRGRRH